LFDLITISRLLSRRDLKLEPHRAASFRKFGKCVS